MIKHRYTIFLFFVLGTIGVSTWKLRTQHLYMDNQKKHSFNEDALVAQTVFLGNNREPVIMHAAHEKNAREKLAALEKRTGKRPNILIFLMDDVGWGDLGAFGGGIAVGSPTPTMDRLAREGLKLTSTYSQPTCTPSRATIMTGRLPMRTGLLRPPMYGEKGGLEGEITLAQLLQKAGYSTQAVGKWHLGENEASQPQNVGFDDFFGFLGVSDMYTEWRDPYFYPEIVYNPERTAMVEKSDFNKYLVHASRNSKLENVKEITIPVLSELDELWADYSVRFIKNAAKSNKPFFLYHCTRAGHFDNYPNARWRGSSPAKHPYKDCLVEVDDILKRILEALQETGQLENTFIFVTSDNGPEMEIWPDSGYTPFRSSKGSTWEGGQRVPGIAYWKDMIAPGRESDGVFDQADLFATLLTLSGSKDSLPTDRYIDSIDQTSFLLADEGVSNRKFIYYWLQDQFSAVRCGEFKYYRSATLPDYRDTHNVGGLSGSHAKYNYGKFFNLYLDPKEEHSYLIRKLVYSGIFFQAFANHEATFVRYPPKSIVSAP